MSAPDKPILEDIRESLANQQTSGEPTVRDVVLPKIRRERPYTLVGSYAGTLTTSTTLETDTQLTFAMSTLGNSSSWVTVFDQFRIIGVRVRFFPCTISGGGTPSQFVVYSAIDYDDSAGTAASSLIQYDTLKVGNSLAYWERSLVPKVALALYSGSTFTNYGSAGSRQWIDCTSSNTPYYGLKIAIPATAGTSYIQYVVEMTVQFRNIR
jgi:hypothetical protein